LRRTACEDIHYSITSSASASNPGGIVNLSVLAVSRLMRSSNLDGERVLSIRTEVHHSGCVMVSVEDVGKGQGFGGGHGGGFGGGAHMGGGFGGARCRRSLAFAFGPALRKGGSRLASCSCCSAWNMTAMVAAVRVHKTGGPEVLTYEDIPSPTPGPRPGQNQEPRLGHQLY
jgi:hypothetical protein